MIEALGILTPCGVGYVLLTSLVIPRVSHLLHVGVPWSHLILEMRHGSHDLLVVSTSTTEWRRHTPWLAISPQHVEKDTVRADNSEQSLRKYGISNSNDDIVHSAKPVRSLVRR